MGVSLQSVPAGRKPFKGVNYTVHEMKRNYREPLIELFFSPKKKLYQEGSPMDKIESLNF